MHHLFGYTSLLFGQLSMIHKNNSYDFRKVIPSPEISIFGKTVSASS